MSFDLLIFFYFDERISLGGKPPLKQSLPIVNTNWTILTIIKIFAETPTQLYH